jgi:O-antigen/teichoic acid export membrane protein
MSKGFIRSVGSVFTGTLIAQLIPIVGTLVLARIFDPASFGFFSAWQGAVLFLGVVLTCRFEVTLAVEADGAPRRSAVAMTLLTIALCSLVAIILLVLGCLLGAQERTGFPVALLILFVPVAALVSGMQTLQNWAAADGRYRQLSVMRITQSTSIVGVQICVGMLSPDASGLALGYFAGALTGFLVSWFLEPMARNDFVTPWLRLRAFWREKKRFPMFSLPADSVNAAAAQLPVLLVTARFGAEAAGLLAMALRMLGAPMSLLAASVLDVFKRHAGQGYRERGECRAEYLHAFRILLGVASLAAIAIAFGAEPIFALAFGDAWLGAGTMALWLLPRFAIGFVASPLSYMVYVAGKQQLDLVWQVTLLGMTLVTLSFAPTAKDALISYGVGYGGLYLLYLAMSYRFSLGRGR